MCREYIFVDWNTQSFRLCFYTFIVEIKQGQCAVETERGGRSSKARSQNANSARRPLPRTTHATEPIKLKLYPIIDPFNCVPTFFPRLEPCYSIFGTAELSSPSIINLQSLANTAQHSQSSLSQLNQTGKAPPTHASTRSTQDGSITFRYTCSVSPSPPPHVRRAASLRL